MTTPPDATFPTMSSPPGMRLARVAGVTYRSTRWTPKLLTRLMESLAENGADALRGLSTQRLASAWSSTVESFIEPDPGSPQDALRDVMTRTTGLSKVGLQVALRHVLSGVTTRGALDLLARKNDHRYSRPAVALMSSNLPGLAVQSLLPALALRRPLLLKSASSEPFFAPTFVASLVEQEPALGAALAAVCWPGGTEDLERVVFDHAGRVVAYGDADTADTLGRRLGSKLVMHGPKISIAVLGSDAVGQYSSVTDGPPHTLEPSSLADGLARDVALFDQRGCLSVQAIFVLGDDARSVAEQLAEQLGQALGSYGHRWPPGAQTRATAAGVRQWRDDAIMAGLWMSTLPFASGTVIVADEPTLRPSPGGRTVRIHAIPSSDELLEVLEPWRDRLQGAAVAGEQALAMESQLRDLGISRLAAPGALQHPDLSTWHNGGLAPLAAFEDPIG